MEQDKRECIMRDGLLYKVDANGREGLAEDVASVVYGCLPGLRHVGYASCRFVCNGREVRGCRSTAEITGMARPLWEVLMERDADYMEGRRLQPEDAVRSLLCIVPEIPLQELADMVLLDSILLCQRDIYNFPVEESNGVLALSAYSTVAPPLLSSKKLALSGEVISTEVDAALAGLSMKWVMAMLSLGAEPLRLQHTELLSRITGYQNTVYGRRDTSATFRVLEMLLQRTDGKLWEHVG